MTRLKAGAAGLILCFHSTAALAATPQFGTVEGERACVALMGLAVASAGAMEPPSPRMLNAMTMGLGFYMGRLSKVDPRATKQDVDGAMAKLTLEEKNTYVNLCLSKARELTEPTLK